MMIVVSLTSLSAIGLLAATLGLPLDQPSVMPQADGVPVQFSSAPRPPGAPGSAGGWSMLIARRGGLADASRSDLIVTSAGSVACGSSDPCERALGGRDLANISNLVKQSWAAIADMSASSVCSDCSRTLVIIRRRDDAGVEQTHVVSWDVTTQGRVAPEFLNLVSAATSFFAREARR